MFMLILHALFRLGSCPDLEFRAFCPTLMLEPPFTFDFAYVFVASDASIFDFSRPAHLSPGPWHNPF